MSSFIELICLIGSILFMGLVCVTLYKSYKRLNAVADKFRKTVGQELRLDFSDIDSFKKFLVTLYVSPFTPVLYLGIVILFFFDNIYHVIIGAIILSITLLVGSIYLLRQKMKIRKYELSITEQKKECVFNALMCCGFDFVPLISSIQKQSKLLKKYNYYTEIVEKGTEALVNVIEGSFRYRRITEESGRMVRESLKEFNCLLTDLINQYEKQTAGEDFQQNINRENERFVSLMQSIRKDIDNL